MASLYVTIDMIHTVTVFILFLSCHTNFEVDQCSLEFNLLYKRKKFFKASLMKKFSFLIFMSPNSHVVIITHFNGRRM